jgi:hypothetical protein
VLTYSNPTVKSARKPSFSPSTEPSSHRKYRKETPHKRAASPKTPLHKRKRDTVSKRANKLGVTAGRRTLNSITTFTPVFDSKLPQPHADIQIPPPPSRSPSPPTEIQPVKNGNRYTDADKEYFIKFISWRLKGDPSLTKRELCELLSQKVYHFLYW